MKEGDRFVINLELTYPDFHTEYNFPPDLWPSYDVFNFAKWRSDDTYMQVVKPSENSDSDGTPDHYYMHDNFLLVILATCRSESDCSDLLSRIPHSG